MKTCVSIKNSNGASLLEVMIAMVILTVAFLGVVALSTFLFKTNAQATNMNIATEIAQSEVSQLNCLGATVIKSNLTNWGITALPGTYTYTVSPTIQNPDARDPVPACIYPALAKGGPAPGGLPPLGLGITIPYTVSITFSSNPNNSNLIDAAVTVSWNNGQQAVNFYDVVV